MTFTHHDGSAGRVRIPEMRTIGDEFLDLMDERERIDRRINALLDLLAPQPSRLPLSGLRQAAPNVLLFKGGRHA